jgi:FkbM family methyltransferase
MFLSYAQQAEDVLLARLFPQENGFFIDVGANHPTHWSLTKLFSDRGWTGINVEPGAIFSEIEKQRPHDINLRMAISDQPGTMSFYEFPDQHGLSTLDEVEASTHHARGFRSRVHSVPVESLASICKQYVGERTIDFLSIDVEGHELAVIRGADWEKFRPICVIIEAVRPCSTITSHEEWEPLILAANYQLAAFDGLNRYYIRAESSDLIPRLALPANVFDGYLPYHLLPSQAQEYLGELQTALNQARHDLKRLGVVHPIAGSTPDHPLRTESKLVDEITQLHAELERERTLREQLEKSIELTQLDSMKAALATATAEVVEQRARADAAEAMYRGLTAALQSSNERYAKLRDAIPELAQVR